MAVHLKAIPIFFGVSMNARRFYPFLVLDALFEGGRLFIGATSAAYLLSQGLSLSEIALLKSLQAAVLLIAEVPTGMFADIYGRKNSLLASTVIAISGFLIYYFAHTLPLFLIAEALVALSLCFWSGAYEAYAIEHARLMAEPDAMDRFFHLSQALNSASILTFGYLGGVLGQTSLALPYLGAAMVLFLAMIALLTLPKCDANQRRLPVPIKMRARAALWDGLLSKKLAPFFWLNVAIQFAIQPLLHFWQPLFQNLSAAVTPEILGRIFLAYSATNLLSGTAAASLSKYSFFRSRVAMFLLFGTFGIFYLLVGVTGHLNTAVIFFCLAQGSLSVARTALGIRLNRALEGLPRATMLSSLSLVSRLGMIGALGILSFTQRTTAFHTPQELYKGFGVLALAGTLAGGLYVFSRNRRTPQNKVGALQEVAS